MTDEIKEKPKKKVVKKTYVALKTLNCGYMVKKGESFTCTDKEYEAFKKLKAV